MNCWKYFKLYAAQVFDIGNSTGSLLTEIITLFRTFQRISAPSGFITRFSPECTKMFSWATELIDIISNSIHTTPFLNFELFSIYTLTFPLTILTFISTTVYGFSFFLTFILFFGLGSLGFGIALFFSDKKEKIPSIVFMSIGSIVTFVFCITFIVFKCVIYFKKRKYNYNNSINENENANTENENDFNNFEKETVNFEVDNENEQPKNLSLLGKFRLVFSFICSALVFYGTMIRVIEKRWKLTFMIVIVISVLTLAVLITEIIFRHFKNTKILFYQKKLSGLLVNCLSLLVIPSTETFFELIEENEYQDNWFINIAYIVNSILLPLSLILAMIILKHPDIEEKYRKPKYCNCNFNYFYLYEFIDMICQIIYAIFAFKDNLIVCLSVEIFLFVLIIGFRPFNSVSENFLSGGNSLILIISNGTLLYFDKHESDYFSFGVSVFFIVIACVPAILSFYVFFIWDFEIKPDDSENDDDDESKVENLSIDDSIMKLCKAATFISPFVWFCYGLNMPYIVMKFNFSE